MRAVSDKNAAHGTENQKAASKTCSEVILKNYKAWAERSRQKLLSLGRGSKAWWSKPRELLRSKQKTRSIPALKGDAGVWVLKPLDKANSLASHFKSKFVTPTISEEEQYTAIQARNCRQHRMDIPKVAACEALLTNLNKNSGRGPDDIPAQVLQMCARVLATPIYLLGLAILRTGQWPRCWRLHHLVPLHKRKSKHERDNYRAIHLTAHLSKTLERFIGLCFDPYIATNCLFGKRQWAYQKRKGARDAILYLIITWLLALASGQKIILFCSDVAGAFDRVDTARLVSKLVAMGLDPAVVAVLSSWLESRCARVIVGGCCSEPIELTNMVFQGTVLGPKLWNLFYEDVKAACRDAKFEETVFADDLNSFKTAPASTTNDELLQQAQVCQSLVHSWGRANGVSFEASKEGFHVFSRTDPWGDVLKLLGILFDTKLLMDAEVQGLVQECAWRVTQLLRGGRFFAPAELLFLYKQHVLSHMGYRTSAIYHGSDTVLEPLQGIQRRVLKAVGLTDLDALVHFKLAPLATRRDIAVLGLIHRQTLGRGPPQLESFFQRAPEPLTPPRTRLACNRHRLQLISHCTGQHKDFLKRSVLGAIDVYNLLPPRIVEAASDVPKFQGMLQSLVKERALAGCSDWALSLSPRIPVHAHPLLQGLL